jgi:hypothetical protein
MFKIKIRMLNFNIQLELRRRNLIFTLNKCHSNELVFTRTQSHKGASLIIKTKEVGIGLSSRRKFGLCCGYDVLSSFIIIFEGGLSIL